MTNKKLMLLELVGLFFLSGCLPRQKVVEEGGEEVSPSPPPLTVTEGQEEMKKILFVVAPVDFRDEEYLKPKAVLEGAGYEIVTASKGVREAKGSLGATADVDLDVAQAQAADYSAVVFVGGSGTTIYFSEKEALRLAEEANDQGKVVGAICIAPSILANAGILKGKKATVYSSEAENLKSKGAFYINQPVVFDGKIVTANGPGAAEEFGRKILEILGGS